MTFRFKIYFISILFFNSFVVHAIEQQTIDMLKTDLNNNHHSPYLTLLSKYTQEQPSVAIRLAEQLPIEDKASLIYIQHHTYYALALFRYGNFKNLSQLIERNLTHSMVRVDHKIYQTNIILLAKIKALEGKFTQAESILLEYFTHFSNDDENNNLNILNTLADIYIQQGFYGKALSYIFSSFSRLNIANLQNDKLSEEQVYLIIITADILNQSGYSRTALELLQAIEDNSFLNQPKNKSSWLLTLASSKSKIGYSSDAISAIESFREIVRQITDLPKLALLMEQSAQLSVDLELIDSATEWANRAKNLFTTFNSLNGLANNKITFFELDHLTQNRITTDTLNKLQALTNSDPLYSLPIYIKRLHKLHTFVVTKLNQNKSITPIKLDKLNELNTDESAIFNYQVKSIESFLLQKALFAAKNIEISQSYQIKYTYTALAIFIVLLLYLSNSRLQSKQKINTLNNKILKLEKKLALANDTNNHDSLTGLYSHRYISGFIKEASIQSQQKFKPYTIILFSIDHFNELTEQNGYECGNVIIKNIAKILDQVNKDLYTIGRWGNEEFIVCLANTRIEKSKKFAEQVRILTDQSTMQYEGTFHNITISLGLASAHPNEPFDELLTRVDHALLQASKKGNSLIVHRDHF